MALEASRRCNYINLTQSCFIVRSAFEKASKTTFNGCPLSREKICQGIRIYNGDGVMYPDKRQQSASPNSLWRFIRRDIGRAAVRHALSHLTSQNILKFNDFCARYRVHKVKSIRPKSPVCAPVQGNEFKVQAPEHARAT